MQPEHSIEHKINANADNRLNIFFNFIIPLLYPSTTED